MLFDLKSQSAEEVVGKPRRKDPQVPFQCPVELLKLKHRLSHLWLVPRFAAAAKELIDLPLRTVVPIVPLSQDRSHSHRATVKSRCFALLPFSFCLPRPHGEAHATAGSYAIRQLVGDVLP
jgi:hypothetical protein